MPHSPAEDDFTPDRLVDLAERLTRAEAETGSLPGIVQLGHPVLRARALDYSGQLGDELLGRLLATMRKVMHAAPGVGLAAPQLGLPLRLAVMEDLFPVDPATAEARGRTPLEYFAAVNPGYSAVGARTSSHFEGCLSFAGFTAVVERPEEIEARYTGPDGTGVVRSLRGWPARIFQHEADHLDGTVYIDRAVSRSLCTSEAYAARWQEPRPDAAARGLGFALRVAEDDAGAS
ncbi:peptide deformylase [Zafaria sp. Z1313]|uniref:peptide deformylase n=1 Tax=unclassified Zafaria TaxID=2828765 RepID=UPI002E75D55F|nr:peptide deformylase [Zafaria sp. J156]MEE1621194.1 peptide deformylase [Zafaria sp. J156]